MPRDAAPSSRAGVVIPLRSFTDAKARLTDHLDASARAEAMRSMAECVLAAADPMPVLVVSSAPEVREWAITQEVEVIDDPGTLDAAASAGVAHLADRGFDRAVVAHADLPHVRSLATFTRDGRRPIVALAPCHRDDGTNVLAIPTTAPFRFAYGVASFRNHLAEARRLGLGTRVVRDPNLAHDVDELADLAFLTSVPPSASSARVGSP